MEGIEQNPVVYDLMSEMAFQHEIVDVKVTRNSYLVFKIICLSIVYSQVVYPVIDRFGFHACLLVC